MLDTQSEQHLENQSGNTNSSRYDYTEKLLDEISLAIQSYKGSLSSLSSKTGVDPKTIRKMSKREYKRSPNADTIQRILAAISKERTLKGIAKFYGGAIDIYLQKAFPHFFLEDAKPHSEEISEIIEKITDKYSYYVVKLLSCYSSRAGLNKYEFIDYLTRFIINNEEDLFHSEISDDLISVFKPIATHKFEYFKKIGLVEECRDKGSVSIKNNHCNLIIPFELVQKYEGALLNLSEPEYWKELDFFTFTVHDTCSKEEVNKISKIMYEAYLSCRRIVQQSDSSEVPVNILSSIEALKYHKRKDVR